MNTDKITLSLSFDTGRTYVALTRFNDNIPELLFINSTEHPLDFSDDNNQSNQPGKDEIIKLLTQIEQKPDEIQVALTNEHFVLTKIPYKVGISGEEIKELISYEIENNYDSENVFDLNCILTPFFDNHRESDYIFLTMFRKKLSEHVNELLSDTGQVKKITTRQFAALNSFVFNYPELNKANTILFGLNQNDIEIAYFVGGKPESAYFKLTADENTLDIVNTEYNRIKTKTGKDDFTIFAYGERLTAQFLEDFSLIANAKVHRLNAFRNYTTNLDDRAKKYCSRTAHIYPACLGAALPDFAEHIILFNTNENN
jgi:hypothetical protein